MSYHTLLLDSNWDITLDAGGGIAQASDDYAIAQDVANAVRLFTEDAFFDQDRGIPHFDIELGHKPALGVLQARIREAAEAVEGVESAAVTLSYDEDTRTVGGEILLTTDTGATETVVL